MAPRNLVLLPRRLSPKALAAGIIALALAARMTAALTIPTPLMGDANAYDMYGETFSRTGSLVEQNGSPLTYRPPGYPAFVGAVYAVAGHDPKNVTVLQAFFGATLVFGVFLFVRRRFSDAAAVWASLLLAISPAGIYADGSLLSESVGTVLLLSASALGILALERRSLWYGISAGLVCSVMTLCRSVMVFYPLVLAGSFLLYRSVDRGTRLRLGVALVFAYALGLAPWLVRNRISVGKATISTNAGATLYASWVHPPGSTWGNNVVDATTDQAHRMSFVEADRFLVRQTFERVRADPLTALKLIPAKIALLLVPWDWEIVGRGRVKAWNFHWPALAALAFFAFISSPGLRCSHYGLLVLLAFGSLLATSLMFYGSPRFRVPFEALLAVPAALSLERMRQRLFASEPNAQTTA